MEWIQNHRRNVIHYTMSAAGGIFGAYAVLSRGGNFGAAQTMNLMELVLGSVTGSWQMVLNRSLIFLSYLVSLMAAFLIGRRCAEKKYRICLMIEYAGVFLAGMIPMTVNHLAALCPVFAVSAFQWQIFTNADCYNSSTLFSTNNMRQAAVSWVKYHLEGNPEEKRKAFFFSYTLLCFHIGVLAGYYAVCRWSYRGIWLGFLPLTVVYVLSEPESFDKERGCRKII